MIKHGIFRSISGDLIAAVAFTVLLLIGGTCADANAQVVQPQYVRPSKGAVLQTFSATVSASVVSSSTFDWTAFSAASVSIRWANASGNRCSCPSGVDNCAAVFTLGYKTSTSKTGPFGDIVNTSAPIPLIYNPSAPVTEPYVSNAGVFNIDDPYVQFFSAFTAYTDTGTGLPVTGCFMTVTVTPIPFTSRVFAEGPATAAVDGNTVKPLMAGGYDYVPFPGTSTIYSVNVNRVNTEGVLAVGPGSGAPILPATSPIAVAASPAAATLIYTSTTAQRGVTLQNVGPFPVACAIGTNAASVSLTRYSIALAASSTTGDGTGGSYSVEQLPPGTTNGRVYCIGRGGASSIAIMPQ